MKKFIIALLLSLGACGVTRTTYLLPQGPQGEKGEQGQQGQQGEPGQPGAPGLNGTLVLPVLPCPSLPGSYPEVFLCIEDKLYAVFDPSHPGSVRYTELIAGVSYVTT